LPIINDNKTIMPNENENNMDQNKSKRGFAAMNEEKQREIASKGGKAAHASGNAHEFDSEEARAAGRKGGLASHKNR
jgi:hypothetical protein